MKLETLQKYRNVSNDLESQRRERREQILSKFEVNPSIHQFIWKMDWGDTKRTNN